MKRERVKDEAVHAVQRLRHGQANAPVQREIYTPSAHRQKGKRCDAAREEKRQMLSLRRRAPEMGKLGEIHPYLKSTAL